MVNSTALCFFIISVTYTIGWTTISSELAYFKHLFGPAILLQLNLAYFLPSIPILLLQTWLDEHFDDKFGPGKATAFRFSFGFGGILGVSLAYPLLPEHRAPILASVALLGVASGILFGSSYQLVSRFPANNIVALTLGYVASGPLVLLLNAIFRIGPTPAYWQRAALFASVSIVTLAGLAAALHIFRTHWDELDVEKQSHGPEAHPLVEDIEDSLSRPNSVEGHVGQNLQQRSKQHVAAMLEDQHEGDSESDSDGDQWLNWAPYNGQAPPIGPPRRPLSPLNHPPEGEAPPRGPPRTTSFLKKELAKQSTPKLLRAIAVPAIALSSNITTSVLLFPFFTFVPSSGQMQEYLPQRLFAARVIADILGRLLPKRALVRKDAALLSLAGFKVAITPLFFMYIDGYLPFEDDRIAVGYVAVFWWLSGYINTCSYVAAPTRVLEGSGPRAGALMALIFQLSSLGALLLAQAVQSFMYHSHPGR